MWKRQEGEGFAARGVEWGEREPQKGESSPAVSQIRSQGSVPEE